MSAIFCTASSGVFLSFNVFSISVCTVWRKYREKRSRVLALGVVQLVDRGLELWVLLDVLLEYILIVRIVGNREISCLGCPVCLRLCRYQIFHELSGCLCLYVILILDCPEGCSADGHTALICILDARKICGSHLKGAVDIV